MGTDYELPTWAPLPALADEGFDRLAATVARRLGVDRSLVVLVSKAGQVIPGAFGLPEPWATRRSMPLTHSLSQRVTTTGEPLVLRDAREDPATAESPSVRELGVVAYAGMPLWGAQGRPIGVLVACDLQPRDWTAAELEALRRLAAEGSRQLQVQAVELAEREALAAAVRDDGTARAAAERARSMLVEAEAEADRTRLVARLSGALLTAGSLPEVLRAVDRFVRSPLGSRTVLLGVAESGCADVRVWSATAGAPPSPEPVVTLTLTDPHPLTAAMTERRLVTVATLAEAGDEFPQLAPLAPGTETVLATPLVLGQHSAIGALALGWTQRRELDGAVRAVAADLALHVGHALDRELLQEHRRWLATDPADPAPLSP
ncbi:GAF domain-containing protein [Modestobacter muralis]|uniref:GAF domain-containing protein n=1 Tax=Modestobacter muralis TaxID=1608614 RepID=A0A6P0ESE9_9ACTN|nr:GAF domain-containing protein [Modestobacter muralis]NEK93835.1 GAF domain-containing protein [Modestobacter muralis]NEN50602.1 GAF domain-containing protein [Modestobacter muralis]